MSAFFRKSSEKKCAWCEHGVGSEYSEDIFCKKRGVVSRENACGKYKYDPLKRTPKTDSISNDYKAEDFSL